jgi:hypothetical protein
MLAATGLTSVQTPTEGTTNRGESSPEVESCSEDESVPFPEDDLADFLRLARISWKRSRETSYVTISGRGKRAFSSSVCAL